jgi:hypothetical protein
MKLSKLALAGALACVLSAKTGYAQSGWGQPQSARQTAFEYNSYYAQDIDEQADAKAEGLNQEEAPAAAGGPETPAPMPGGGTILNPCCNLGELWKLVDNECLKCRNINVAGFMAHGYNWNTSNPADKFNGPVIWTDRSNEYNLNSLWMYIEKPTDTKGCGTDFGFRIDGQFGTSNRFSTESGLGTRGYFQQPTWSTQRFYGFNLPQAYAEAAWNTWKIKAGVWISPVGYETVNTNANFFTSVPMTYAYGEAFTHTGILATNQYSETVVFGVGLIRGWDNFDNSNPNLGVITTYTEKFNDGAQIAVVDIVSNELTQNSIYRQRFLNTVAYSRPLKSISENLTYVLQTDFGFQNDALLNGKDARWYGLNQYLFYKVSDCMSYGLRAEWFRDEEGFRVGGYLGTTNPPGGSDRGLSTNRAGYPGSFYEITAGANWKYSANTMVRPYVRFDWFSGTSLNPNGIVGNPERPFDGGFGNSQTLLGFDVITLF